MTYHDQARFVDYPSPISTVEQSIQAERALVGVERQLADAELSELAADMDVRAYAPKFAAEVLQYGAVFVEPSFLQANPQFAKVYGRMEQLRTAHDETTRLSTALRERRDRLAKLIR